MNKEEQSQRFIETAKEHECDENEAEFLKKLGKLAEHKPEPDDKKQPKD